MRGVLFAVLAALAAGCSAPEAVVTAHRQEGEYTAALAGIATEAVQALQASTPEGAERKARVLAAIASGAQGYAGLHEATQQYLESLGLFGSEEQERVAIEQLLALVRELRGENVQ